MTESKQAPTFVLVHGAWADGTGWHKVIDALEASGAKVVAAPIPLTSVSDDVRALDGPRARRRIVARGRQIRLGLIGVTTRM